MGSVTEETTPDASFAVDFEGNDQQEQESSTKTEATSEDDNNFAAEFDTAFDSFADFSKMRKTPTQYRRHHLIMILSIHLLFLNLQ